VNILALLGSPRPKGNTQAVLEMVLAAAGQAGATSKTIQLSHLKDLRGCMECFECQSNPGEPGCAVKDDMQPILAQALRADAIVLATPVFCWSPAWPIKMAMDRFYCMFKFNAGDEIKCLLAGKRMAAVITAGGGQGDGADLVMATCQRMARFSQCEWLGALIAANVETPDAIRADAALADRARAFGRKLASCEQPEKTP
jgi:multimeric flavodoxin WrbA